MAESFIESSIQIDDTGKIMNLFGNFDHNLKVIENEFNVNIIIREGEEKAVGMVRKTLDILLNVQETGEVILSHSVSYTIKGRCKA